MKKRLILAASLMLVAVLLTGCALLPLLSLVMNKYEDTPGKRF